MRTKTLKYSFIAVLSLIILLITGGYSRISAGSDYQKAGPVITFTSMAHDFGDFAYGEIVYTRFPFRNTGNAPLVITDVERPCGCLKPMWPKNPIMPGDTGSIQVYYNSDQRPGVFRKTMLIYSNTKSDRQVIILVKGNADKKIKKKKNN
jgi:hypothetical protein